ncbi:MAG: peptide chain release factor 1 [Bryobacterales bacterium]|nr:peptide chain release factor 1 [Bryobacterales bacterium]
MKYRERLDVIEQRFEALTAQMADAEVISNPETYRKTAKAQVDLSETVDKYRQWKKVNADLEGARAMLAETDEEMRALAQEDVTRLEPELEKIENELKILLLPKDPNDEKNVIVEIRGSAGGDEATLFAGEVFRMYARWAETLGWKVEIMSSSESSVGGMKEVIATFSGTRVYSRMKYEGGVHRVQRVPATETQGRIHTSTITVAVMPEAEEVDIKLEAKDIRVDTFCSSGPGGQSVNTTYSAVRMTHIPTGTVVSCQDEKSQIKNRAKAERVLRSRLYEIEQAKQAAEIGAERKAMVGTGDRSEKIRTYNFKDNRVTDHRCGITMHQLDLVMQGQLSPLIDAVVEHFQRKKLEESEGPAKA